MAEREALDAYGKLPASFVENAGQADARFRYYAQGAGYGFGFAQSEAILSFVKGKRGAALALRFLGARPQAEPEGARQLPGKVNYLIGNDPAKWQTGLRTYGEVRYVNLWPGVDMVFRGGKGQLKYEFLLRPGARVQDVRLGYRGAKRLSLDRRGNLLIRTSLGVLTDTRPMSYQVIGGKRMPVESRFVLGRGGGYGFAVGRYDPRRPLVIDPGLVYSTYLGGSANDPGFAIALDGMGSAYVTGFTASANFPTTAGDYDTSFDGLTDAFVTKLNPSGSALVYSTYLGGSGFDGGSGIAVDAAGNAYVTGGSGSASFPTTPGAFDTSLEGVNDAFVTKLNPAGSALVYSTYLGGSANEGGSAIALNGAGSAHVTGSTASANFPTTAGAYDTSLDGVTDAFVTKLNPAGSSLAYSTYVGGGGFDGGLGIALDASGSAHVTGFTTSANFPTTAGAFDTSFDGDQDGFVTKLNSAGSALGYATYLGGSGSDRATAIVLDGAGSAYVTGGTGSADFPTTPGAFDTTFNGGTDAFVTKVNGAGSALVYSTYLGGSEGEGSGDEEPGPSGLDTGSGIALDGAGSAYVTGSTASANFPTTAGAFDTSYNGGGVRGLDAFVTKLNASGSALLYSTYLGGSDDELGVAIALGAAGSAHVTGFTRSADFPTTAGAFDTSYNGNEDAFVTKLVLVSTPATLTLEPVSDTNTAGEEHCVTATVRDQFGNPVPGVTVDFDVSGVNPRTGAALTDSDGQASFCYTGTVAGTDTISAFADTDGDGTQDAGEPGGTASKTWTAGPPATLTLSPPTATNEVGSEHCVTATVEDAFGNPVEGVTVEFSVTGANPGSGSDVTDANGEAEFCYTGTVAGDDTITATAQGGSNPSDTATKTWRAGPPFRLDLQPETATNVVDSQHCVTATVRDQFGNPTPNITVRFSVSGSVTTSGSQTTDANGQATFCYTGPALPGADVITAYADTNDNGVQDRDEPGDTATKTWVLPASTEGCEVTYGGRITAANGDKGTFGGNAQAPDKGQEEYQDHGPAQPMNVHSIVQAVVCSTDGTQASIFGQATIDGSGTYNYRIDLQDLGEPGTSDTYRIRLSNGYDSGVQVLNQGNVQIHKQPT